MTDLLWIPVPGGFADGRPLLRVLIVPRLDGGPLDRHGMAEWPPTALTGGTVRAELFGAHAGLHDPPGRQLDIAPVIPFQPGVWKRMLAGLAVEDATRRQGFVSGADLEVHATSADADAVARTFQEVAKADVTPELGPMSPDFDAKVRHTLDGEHWQQPDPPAPSPAPLPPPSGPPGFHRALSLLREHPAVLRALGLIFELRLGPHDASDFAGGTVRVTWPGRPASLPPVVSPRTVFGPEFRPGSTSRVSAGMVTLDQTDADGSPLWRIATVDVDIAAQRLREAARALDARPAERPTLPALRSDGLQLVLRGRGEEMRERLNRAARFRQEVPDVLTADDLVLGYRIDVLPELGGEHWFSLHRRRATYTVHEHPRDRKRSEDSVVVGVTGAPEEGHIKTNAAVSDWTGLHADEIVAGWRGWSLAVPRPPLDGTPAPAPPTDPGLNIAMSFEVEPGSLPRLRFGHHYTLRARVADMAGGGLGIDDDAAQQHWKGPEFYARHEPLLSPDVTYTTAGDPGQTSSPGESVAHVVVRSDPMSGLDVEAFAGRYGYALNDKRLLLPPAGTLALAEQHGMFDLDGDEAVASHVTWEWVKRLLTAVEAEAPAPGEPPLPDPAAGGIVVEQVEPHAHTVLTRSWEGLDEWPDLLGKTLRVTTPQPGRPALAWEGEQLVVRLAPAGELTLRISSFPREGIIDEFAVHGADPPENAVKALRQGRHPLVTPARTLTVVHAVQRPLRVPDTVLTVNRDRNATVAALTPQSPVFDPPSTAEVHITAHWEDQMDTVRREVTDAPVATLTVDPDGPAQPGTLFRHEFGDTRHRSVTYTLKAVSRFRQYFRDPAMVDEFTVTKELPPVVVPSAARPAPPVLLSARPAFRWQETGSLQAPSNVLNRERLGGRIRLALQPPWYDTGAGEQLAVVVRPEGANLEDGLSAYVSLAGSDPLYPSKGLPIGSPFAPHISSATAPDRRVPLEEAGTDVVVKPHQPEYHEDEACWLCDVALTGTDTTSFDFALVQLAVARYQPDSLPGLWLSPVVRTDTVPLLPDRALRVTRLPDRFEVKLTGLVSPAPAVNRVDMILERCRIPGGAPADQVDLIGFDTSPADVPAWHRVDLRSPSPQRVGLSSRVKSWTSEFRPPPGPGALRVRVREVEFIPNNTPRPGAHLQSATPGEITERTVFTDTVLLPGL